MSVEKSGSTLKTRRVMSAPQKFKHALFYGDTHFPFEDSKAVRVVKALASKLKPERVIHMGDLIDCWQISTFDKDPLRRNTLQDDIDKAMEHLKEVFMATPNAEHYYLEGNHEFRLTKTICRMPESQRELARLRVFQRHVSWSGIMEECGVGKDLWEFIPMRGQARRRLFPKLITKHGNIVSKWSAMTAKREWERYGCSGISGHTHRMGLFYHNDFNGAHAWAETGCTCDLHPEYTEDPDWQHGLVVGTFTNDWKYFVFEPVYIQQGNAIWRDWRIKL
jgi:predicted phosphodiesterase